ncbi:ferrous iron transport protein A [bacterium]|nr:ferrous iron transport protein A [bacterium]
MHRKKTSETNAKTVNDLLPGERGYIYEITAPESIRQRIMDMGIIEGVMIEMVRSAPLGDPVQIKVLDTLLALRRSEASMLVIESVGETDHGRKRYRHRFGREPQQR